MLGYKSSVNKIATTITSTLIFCAIASAQEEQNYTIEFANPGEIKSTTQENTQQDAVKLNSNKHVEIKQNSNTAQEQANTQQNSSALKQEPTEESINIIGGDEKAKNTSQSFTIENNTNDNHGSNELIQEVSVKLLTTFDDAVLEGFRSLENSLTLGLGKSVDLTVDDVAPALRGFKYDVDGNIIFQFSIPMAQAIVKKMGASSWNGLSNPILVWMVGLDKVNDANKFSIISGQNLSPFASQLLDAAPEYKYRFVFPILDIEDLQKVRVETILEKDNLALKGASVRYGADYFLSCVIDNTSQDGNTVSFKWNLYNKNGDFIANSDLSGLNDEVASLSSGDIARALMTYQYSNPQNNIDKSSITKNNVDIDLLGPGEGFVRLKISNVRSLEDIASIKKVFSTYGFDGDTRVIGFNAGYVILELVTNSNASNIEGSMRHGGDFTYLAPWTFSLNSNTDIRAPKMPVVSRASQGRPNSQINGQSNVEIEKPSLHRDRRDVGQGEGLPSRNTPAIQGVSI